VTLDGKDKLLPKEDNTINLVEPPTEEEVNRAITAPMRRMVTVMKAATKFKRLIAHKRPDFTHGMFGSSPMVAPPESLGSESENDGDLTESHLSRIHTDNLAERKPIEGNLTTEGIIREIDISDDLKTVQASHKIDIKDKGPMVSKGQWASILRGVKPHMPFHANPQKDEERSKDVTDTRSTQSSRVESPSRHELHTQWPLVGSPSHQELRTQSDMASPVSDHGRGQAHDPLTDTLFLHIGASADDPAPDLGDLPIISESPSAVVEADVYERAYEEEIQKILAQRKQQGLRPTLFLTKRVEGIDHLRNHDDITDFTRAAKQPVQGLARLAAAAKEAAAKEREAMAKDSIPTEDEESDKPGT
jgi:calcium/calmodulin-dependent protein kinase kinase 2